MAEVELLKPGSVRGDLKLIEQSLKTPGWEIPEKLLETLPKIMGSIALTGTNREKTAATRVVVAMKRFNEMAIENQTPKIVGHLHKHQMLEGDIPSEGLDEWREDIDRRIDRIKRISGDA